VLLVLVRAAAAVGNVNNDDPTSIDPIAAASSQKSWNAEIGIRTVAVVLFAIRGDHIPPMPIVQPRKTPALNAASLAADFLPVIASGQYQTDSTLRWRSARGGFPTFVLSFARAE